LASFGSHIQFTIDERKRGGILENFLINIKRNIDLGDLGDQKHRTNLRDFS
jgi:hypothetical protein